MRILQVTFQHFLKQIIPDYSNNHVFVQRMPFACFCTTTNVQDKTSVSLKDYVDLRKIMANKVLDVIITKNYNSSFWWQNRLNWLMFTRSCSRGLDCQCDIRLSLSFQRRLILNFVTFMAWVCRSTQTLAFLSSIQAFIVASMLMLYIFNCFSFEGVIYQRKEAKKAWQGFECP